jgi:small subunit ribosomal protein S2e
VRAATQGKIKSLESIYLFSMPVKEYQIVEYFLGSALKDEVMKIMPVQKQTRAGQRTRFKVRRCERGGGTGVVACRGVDERTGGSWAAVCAARTC